MYPLDSLVNVFLFVLFLCFVLVWTPLVGSFLWWFSLVTLQMVINQSKVLQTTIKSWAMLVLHYIMRILSLKLILLWVCHFIQFCVSFTILLWLVFVSQFSELWVNAIAQIDTLASLGSLVYRLHCLEF